MIYAFGTPLISQIDAFLSDDLLFRPKNASSSGVCYLGGVRDGFDELSISIYLPLCVKFSVLGVSTPYVPYLVISESRVG